MVPAHEFHNYTIFCGFKNREQEPEPTSPDAFPGQQDSALLLIGRGRPLPFSNVRGPVGLVLGLLSSVYRCGSQAWSQNQPKAEWGRFLLTTGRWVRQAGRAHQGQARAAALLTPRL